MPGEPILGRGIPPVRFPLVGIAHEPELSAEESVRLRMVLRKYIAAGRRPRQQPPLTSNARVELDRRDQGPGPGFFRQDACGGVRTVPERSVAPN